MGRETIKQFVREAVDEGLKLEAPSRVCAPTRVALLHYAPIVETVEGEPPNLSLPGLSRLEEPIDRYPVALVFHGHAHRGQPGTTQACPSTTSRCRS